MDQRIADAVLEVGRAITALGVALSETEEPKEPKELHSLDDLPESYNLDGNAVQQYGTTKYGILGGPSMGSIRNLLPIKAWEMRSALDGWPKRWPGFAECIVELRKKASENLPGAVDSDRERFIREVSGE